MLKFIYLSILLTINIFFSDLYAGGPWVSPKLGGYFEVGGSFTSASTVTDNTYQLYSEFGITKRLSFKGVIPFKQISSPEDVEETSNNAVEFGKLTGLNNIILGLRYQLSQRLPIAVGFDFSLNTFRIKANQGLRTGYESFTLRPVFAIGGSTNTSYYYAQFMPGFSTNNYSADFTFVLEYGGKISPKSYLALYFQGRIPFSNGNFNDTDASAFEFTGFYIDRQNYYVVGPKLSIGLGKNWGISSALFLVIGRPQDGNVISTKIGLYYQLAGK